MKYLKPAPVILVLAAAIGSMSSAFAGVSGVVETQVEALSGIVTYSTTGAKGLSTKVGYKVTITRSGTNTVNSVVFEGVTSIIAPSGFTPSLPADFVEANDDGGACRGGAVSTQVVCNFGQMRAGESRTFAVFFKGPLETAGNCFTPGDQPCEAVRFSGATNYSEGTGDGSGSFPNDQAPWTVPDVPLGTPNPTKVKSALAKSGGEFFTGTDAVPTTTTFPFAAKLNAPNPPVFSSAEVNLKRFEPLGPNGDDIAQAQLCSSAGNFKRCYEAGVLVPYVAYASVPGGTNYLTTILRIDSTEVISPFRASRAKVFYSDPLAVPPIPETELQFCPADGMPVATIPQLPCLVNNVFRYSNAGPNGELRGDVQIEVHGLKNGFIRPR